jgi:N-acetylglutamate synthase-like GNAT family acetyltransferase
MNIRFANEDDIPALKQLDTWTKDSMWQRKILWREVIVLEVENKIVGLMRYDVLWSTVPFLSLIFIEEPYRGKGYSVELLSFLKSYLRNEGYVALLSSSQTDEPEAQNWHRKMGFKSNGIIENIADDDVGEIVFRLLL